MRHFGRVLLSGRLRPPQASCFLIRPAVPAVLALPAVPVVRVACERVVRVACERAAGRSRCGWSVARQRFPGGPARRPASGHGRPGEVRGAGPRVGVAQVGGLRLIKRATGGRCRIYTIRPNRKPAPPFPRPLEQRTYQPCGRQRRRYSDLPRSATRRADSMGCSSRAGRDPGPSPCDGPLQRRGRASTAASLRLVRRPARDRQHN